MKVQQGYFNIKSTKSSITLTQEVVEEALNIYFQGGITVEEIIVMDATEVKEDTGDINLN